MCKLMLGVVVLFWLPTSAVGQITGRVLDQDGNPIASALVQLLGPGTVLASGQSNAQGEFDLPPEPSGVLVRVSHFAFEETSVGLTDISKPLQVVLSPKPFQLDGIWVDGAAAACPVRDEPEARAAWVKALTRKKDVSNERYWAALVLEWRRSTGFGEDFSPLREVRYDVSVNGGWPRNTLEPWLGGEPNGLVLARKIAPGSLGEGPGIQWEYPRLDGAGVPFLLSHALASVSFIAWDEEAASIVICHKDNRGVKLRLAAVLDGSGHLSEIVWRLATPDRIEETGGHLTFADHPGERTIPFPRTSYSWHRERFGRNFQESKTFSPWFIGEKREVARRLSAYRDSIATAGIGR